MLSLRPQRLRPQSLLQMQSPAHRPHLQHPAHLSQPKKPWQTCLEQSKSLPPLSLRAQEGPQPLLEMMQQPLQMSWMQPPITPLRQTRTRLPTKAAWLPSLCKLRPSQTPLHKPLHLAPQPRPQQQTSSASHPALPPRPRPSLNRLSLKAPQLPPPMPWDLKHLSPHLAFQAPSLLLLPLQTQR